MRVLSFSQQEHVAVYRTRRDDRPRPPRHPAITELVGNSKRETDAGILDDRRRLLVALFKEQGNQPNKEQDSYPVVRRLHVPSLTCHQSCRRTRSIARRRKIGDRRNTARPHGYCFTAGVSSDFAGAPSAGAGVPALFASAFDAMIAT